MKKRIALDEALDLPENIFSRRFPEGDLHIAKDNPNWILTSDVESAILMQLIDKKTIRNAVNSLALQKEHDINEIEESTISLLQKLENYNFYKDATVSNPAVLSLHLYLTNRCNLRCIHCYKDAGMSYDKELSKEEIIRLIDDFSVQGESQIVASGGEVLVRKDFFEIAEHIKSKGHKLNVVTNGTLIENKETALRLADVADFLQISLDGATEQVNDYFRGKGTFRKIIRAINFFENTDYPVNIGMVISEQNYEDIKENLQTLLNDIIRHKVIKINVSGMMDYGRGLVCSHQDSAKYVEKLMNDAGNLGIKSGEWRLPNTKAFDCGYARSITVDADGNVYFCPVANDGVYAGFNIRTISFLEIIDFFKHRNHEISVENMNECTSCELEYICGGGCRLENLTKRGNVLDVGCSSERKDLIYKELIKLRVTV